jgi:hypothetical protein
MMRRRLASTTLSLYDQRVAQNSLASIVPDLAPQLVMGEGTGRS